MKKQSLGMAVVICLATFSFAQRGSHIHALRPFDSHQLPEDPCGNPCEINYYSGPVIERTPTLYIIYYGKWTTRDKNIIDTFSANLGGTTMEKINTTYSDSNNNFVRNAVKHSTSDDYEDDYSLGRSLKGDSDIHTIIRNAIRGGHLPKDTNGIYFVLTAKDVKFPNMCVTLCGYHSPATDIVAGGIIWYSMVGNPAQCKPSQGQCEASKVIGDGDKSPNNDPGADGAVNVMWHELSESSSDPYANLHTAWTGKCGESGDCCAWLFGSTKIAANGAHYNEQFKGHKYLTQMMLQLTSKSRNGNVPAQCENTYQKPQ
jgi:hypothetical protein